MPAHTTADAIEAAVRAPYTRIVRRDPEDGTYVATVLELPGVIAGGETAQEANDSLDEGIRVWVEHELEAGHEIPQPVDPDRFSGRVTLRMTPTLHERAQLRADLEGVSLNRLLEIAIASYLGDFSERGHTRVPSIVIDGQRRRTTTPKIARSPSGLFGAPRAADAITSRGKVARKMVSKQSNRTSAARKDR